MGKIYSVYFEPIALPGENLVILPEMKAFKVEYVEQIPAFIIDFGPIAAGAEIRDRKLSEVEMFENEIGQFRIYFIDNIALRNWRQPYGAGRFFMKNVTPQLDNTFQTIDYVHFSQFTEFFVYKDQVPYVDVVNISGTNLSASRIKLFGYKYVVTPLPAIPSEYKTIPTAGLELR